MNQLIAKYFSARQQSNKELDSVAAEFYFALIFISELKQQSNFAITLNEINQTVSKKYNDKNITPILELLKKYNLINFNVEMLKDEISIDLLIESQKNNVIIVNYHINNTPKEKQKNESKYPKEITENHNICRDAYDNWYQREFNQRTNFEIGRHSKALNSILSQLFISYKKLNKTYTNETIIDNKTQFNSNLIRNAFSTLLNFISDNKDNPDYFKLNGIYKNVSVSLISQNLDAIITNRNHAKQQKEIKIQTEQKPVAVCHSPAILSRNQH